MGSCSQVVVILLVSPGNIEDGWKCDKKLLGIRDFYPSFFDPSRAIKKICSLTYKPKLFIIDCWLEKPKIEYTKTDASGISNDRIRRRCIPRDADIFMIYSTTYTSGLDCSDF